MCVQVDELHTRVLHWSSRRRCLAKVKSRAWWTWINKKRVWNFVREFRGRCSVRRRGRRWEDIAKTSLWTVGCEDWRGSGSYPVSGFGMRGGIYHNNCVVLLAVMFLWLDCCAKPEVHKFWPSGYLGDLLCAVAPNICVSSVWNLLLFVFLAPRTLRLPLC